MDILNNIRYGVELERAQMPDNGLNESPGLMNSLLGTISGATDEGVQRKRDAVTNKAGERLLNQSGYTRAELGIKDGQSLTEGLIGSRVRDYKETKQDTRDTTAFNRSLVPLTKQLEATAEANRMTLASQANEGRLNRQMNIDQFAHTAGEAAKDRALTRDLDLSSNNMNMQMKFMDMDLADKRMAYDRETRRMDKRDRMMAQLMSGLGQLGGAFAL